MSAHIETPAATTARPVERRFPRFWARRQPSPPPYAELDCACGVRIAAAGLVGVLATRKSIFHHTCRVEAAPASAKPKP
ncbi:hypothetical protein CIB93_34765 [Streptomyces sp. WZ.A104]|uniref:hypothetical protein n=1 Tax=Streptomyces sp. WZ.A104 TaxID=2023771 RepID=UPI000BBC549A|nr:hypothetical protein [Streptomyces sp. WZ.A104]PCG81566.1 hypothetical protein CIB93_34765 [Streptomyces sp. WZ.A104]